MDDLRIDTPVYIVDEKKLSDNLAVLDRVQKRSGARILLALKSFSLFAVFPLIRRTLPGVAASGLYEARLGKEAFRGEVHVCAPGYPEEDFKAMLPFCDHISFNSQSQWERCRPLVQAGEHPIRCGLRINPEYSEIKTAIYNPCGPYSRMGLTLDELEKTSLHGITGLHIHVLCEQNADVLHRVLQILDSRFGGYLQRMEWVNLGGGHHITRPDYDIDLLCDDIIRFRKKYGIQVYLEPGEAVALDAGVLVGSVVDFAYNKKAIAVLDVSAACHMPDVMEMPYRPDIEGAGRPGEKACDVRLAGPTCLAGDVIGDYSFDRPLQLHDRIVLRDMAIYTMVKNNTFNGMPLPAIAIRRMSGNIDRVRTFGYNDYKNRLS